MNLYTIFLFLIGQHFNENGDENLEKLEEYLEQRTAKQEAEMRSQKPSSLQEIDKDKLFRLAEESVNEKNLKFCEDVFEFGKRDDNSTRPLQTGQQEKEIQAEKDEKKEEILEQDFVTEKIKKKKGKKKK